MTDAEWDVLAKYVRSIADRLGLRDWWFEILRDPPDGDDAIAEVYSDEGRKHAGIRVTAGFRTLIPEVQRNAIVHELIHCHLHPAEAVTGGLSTTLSHDAWMMLERQLHTQLEYAADGLATAIDEFMPMIRWPTASVSGDAMKEDVV